MSAHGAALNAAASYHAAKIRKLKKALEEIRDLPLGDIMKARQIAANALTES